MIVDADMGMPINLSQYPGLWDYDQHTTEEDYGKPKAVSWLLHLTILDF